jgi:hypothetical protein
MVDGSDYAIMTDEVGYMAAVAGKAFSAPATGYIWCPKHGWVVSDEARLCWFCVDERYEAEERAFEEWADSYFCSPDDGSRAPSPQPEEFEGWDFSSADERA